MICHVAYGYGLFTGGLGAHYGAEKLGCTVVPVSGGMTERQVTLIEDFKPDIIMVTPSYMLAILDEFRKRGLDPRASSLKVGIFGAEPWTNAMRAEIESAFDMHAVDIYGLSEVMGPGVANECVETKDGLHIWEDHFYPEIIDPETGAVLPDGERGELVFTSLTKEAMPVVRYRTRDLTRLLPGTARSMRRMEKVTGRSDDMMIVRGVNVFPTQIEEKLLEFEALSAHYQIVLTRLGRMDEMEVKVEARAGASESAVGRGTRARASHQADDRHFRASQRAAARGHRAFAGQGAPHRRSPAEGLTMARPLAADHGDKRAAILAGAARLFAAEGFDRASMSEIAQALGVSKALVYHYYRSKDALLYDIIRGHLVELVEVAEAASARGRDPEDRLRAVVERDPRMLSRRRLRAQDPDQPSLSARRRRTGGIEAAGAKTGRDRQRDRRRDQPGPAARENTAGGDVDLRRAELEIHVVPRERGA